ncbi:MAG TPA: hypothetical protein PKO33_12110 [Pyrinomonadaceae bacterium]|nr:hypothetical protein [Pyrinomonadaceae bacterium]
MKKNLLSLFLALVFILPSAAFAQTTVKLTSKEKSLADAITAEQMKQYLYFIASDEMEGRDTPSRGLDLTAKFMAMNLARWGFKPAGDDGTYFQKIALRRESLDANATKLSVAGTPFALNNDFFRVSGSGESVDRPLVFGKDGWMVK